MHNRHNMLILVAVGNARLDGFQLSHHLPPYTLLILLPLLTRHVFAWLCDLAVAEVLAMRLCALHSSMHQGARSDFCAAGKHGTRHGSDGRGFASEFAARHVSNAFVKRGKTGGFLRMTKSRVDQVHGNWDIGLRMALTELANKEYS